MATINTIIVTFLLELILLFAKVSIFPRGDNKNETPLIPFICQLNGKITKSPEIFLQTGISCYFLERHLNTLDDENIGETPTLSYIKTYELSLCYLISSQFWSEQDVCPAFMHCRRTARQIHWPLLTVFSSALDEPIYVSHAAGCVSNTLDQLINSPDYQKDVFN